MGSKTGKLIARVLFLSLAAIIMFFSSIIFFNTAKGDHIVNLTTGYLNEKNYDKIQELFGGIYSTEAVVKQLGDNNEIIVTPSGAEKDVLVYPEDSQKASLFHKFTKTYNFYIFNSKFGTASVSENGVKKNNVGIKFITDKKDTDGNAVTYWFPFVVSASINSKVYKEKYPSLDEYWLNYGRNFVSDKSRYGFFNFQINEETIKLIKKKTEGNIVAFNLLDNEGKQVYENNFEMSFKFDEAFYSDAEAGTLFNTYNEYLPYYDSYRYGTTYNVLSYVETNENVYNTKTTKFNEFVDKYTSDVKNGSAYTGVKISANESEIMTSDVIAKAVWRTIGIEALILLVIVVLYILLFHFQQFRDFIFRNDKRTPIRAKVKNVEPEQKENTFKYNQTGNKKKSEAIDVKPTDVNEETKSEE